MPFEFEPSAGQLDARAIKLERGSCLLPCRAELVLQVPHEGRAQPRQQQLLDALCIRACFGTEAIARHLCRRRMH